MRVGVMHRRHTVSGPACVSNTQSAVDTILLCLGGQFSHALGAAGATQLVVLQDGNAARVITTVFKALEALNQNRNDVARTNGADDATHSDWTPQAAAATLPQSMRDPIGR